MADNSSPLETQDNVQKQRRFLLPASVLIVMFIVAAVGTYTWYHLRSSCEVNAVQDASTLLVSQAKRYDDIYQVATSASQDSVVLPVTMLQQILMDTQEVDVPDCMQTVKNELIEYMRTVIRALLAFGAREPDATVRDLITKSDEHYENFFVELEVVTKCAPLCIP